MSSIQTQSAHQIANTQSYKIDDEFTRKYTTNNHQVQLDQEFSSRNFHHMLLMMYIITGLCKEPLWDP